MIERIAKISGIVVAVGTLLFALVQFAFSKMIEAERPYLERKLAWCEEATNTAAIIAMRPEEVTVLARRRFWELHWGVMGLVEGNEVEAAMVAFGKGLKANGVGDPTLALRIAHACRKELSADWSPIWRR